MLHYNCVWMKSFVTNGLCGIQNQAMVHCIEIRAIVRILYTYEVINGAL